MLFFNQSVLMLLCAKAQGFGMEVVQANAKYWQVDTGSNTERDACAFVTFSSHLYISHIYG